MIHAVSESDEIRYERESRLVEKPEALQKKKYSDSAAHPQTKMPTHHVIV